MNDLKEMLRQKLAEMKHQRRFDADEVIVEDPPYTPNALTDEECFETVWNDPTAWTGARVKDFA